MAKINKQYYYNQKGEKRISVYKIIINKTTLAESKINEDDEVKVYAKDGKIIIEKV